MKRQKSFYRPHIRFIVGGDSLSSVIQRKWRLGALLVVLIAALIVGVYLLLVPVTARASEEILLPAYPAPATQQPAEQPYDYKTDPAFDCFPDRAEYNREIVNALQQRLNEYGYYTPQTGRFDEDTGMSVKKFQLDYGLTADGVVGDATYAALNFNTKRWTFSSMWYTADLKHVASVISAEFIYYVNCGDDPHLTVYHKTDQGWRITAQYPCVVGVSTSYDNITPLGYHEVWSCQDVAFEHGGYWYYSPVFYTVNDTPGDDSSVYESQYGIHSVAYDPNNKIWEDWVLNRDYYPTGKMTNGCVRVNPTAAKWIQDHTSVGAPIVIDDRDFADVIR